MPTSRRVHGVDFSGAASAGDGIWLASGAAAEGTFHVEACRPARELADTAAREPALAALRAFLRDAGHAVVGADFPFGLPAPLVEVDTWRAFLDGFADRFADPDDLQDTCVGRTEQLTGGERAFLLRATDADASAKSPYHWLVCHQTFYGVRDVLAPLVGDGAVAVPPMQGTVRDRPALVEAYPAGTLSRFGLPDRGYKDDTSEARARREEILDGLPARLPTDLRERVLADADGDALDAVAAGVAATRAADQEFAPVLDWRPLEGHIYV